MPDSNQNEYNQKSFVGGMNLLGDDSRLEDTQYRAGFNLTNRYDTLDAVLESQVDPATPVGIKQELVTFGNYLILFVGGLAYYRYYTDTGWNRIPGFKMSSTAPRFWTVAIPVSTTNYIRVAATGVRVADTGMASTKTSDPAGVIQLASVLGASAGNLPGLLVQDNINQPQFIFLDPNGFPICRTTQKFSEWSITFTNPDNTTIATDGDKREYVPIGNCMAWDDGVLYIVSQDKNFIYRSVSGRPLDFVINVINILATSGPPYTQTGGGDATTTSYSVGIGGITCLKQLSSGGIFVAAGNANFAVTKNLANNAPKIFGEYTFIRTFLFNSSCLSDRTIFDSIGDTRFIDLTGVRSFNSIQQTQNEGRNTPFTAQVQAAFGSEDNPIIQSAERAAAILYNDYELYAVNTIFGYVICKYDTINKCWTSFDVYQTGGKAIKIFAKIELTVRRLYAITEDDKLYALYIGPEKTTASFRTVGICSNILYANSNIRMANPRFEIQLRNTRAILNKITEDCNCSFTPFINNRLSSSGVIDKIITYQSPAIVNPSSIDLPDVNTQLMNLLWSNPNCEQGWKVFGIFSWTNSSFTQFSMEFNEITPMTPLNSQ